MKRGLSTSWIWMVAAVAAVGCVSPAGHNLPPAERLMEPGPGVGGPGPGVIAPVSAIMPVSAAGPEATQPTVQVLFAKPESMQVRWDVSGYGQFDSDPLIVPGRHEFPEGAIYRLKLTNIPGREGLELYPTLEIASTTPRTAAYLAHNALPVQFTEEDFEQVAAGNFVTKVIYLPDPEFQRLALAGVETLVSTRLDPGVDPIVEADRRGSIMAVVRIGNKDVELTASAAGPAAAAGLVPPGLVVPGAYPSLPGHVAGVTAPTWGMPMTGTPIGLPGPPHIPLGAPAGLQRHVMVNHTPVHIPDPAATYKIHVRQQPGYSYPAPPTRAHIVEQSYQPLPLNRQPHYTRSTEVH
ncbi:MAG: hypothetical protein KatS3mg110_1027 [Pirellulaceae bacterium]|nr:MAG: hypothetical protein KatS3mg110_1027 [Pirellulaceae bacterium]